MKDLAVLSTITEKNYEVLQTRGWRSLRTTSAYNSVYIPPGSEKSQEVFRMTLPQI